MYTREERRSPSNVGASATVTPAGLAFFVHGVPGGSFIPHQEIANIYGSPESWIAHQLLVRAGYPREVRLADRPPRG